MKEKMPRAMGSLGRCLGAYFSLNLWGKYAFGPTFRQRASLLYLHMGLELVSPARQFQSEERAILQK